MRADAPYAAVALTALALVLALYVFATARANEFIDLPATSYATAASSTSVY